MQVKAWCYYESRLLGANHSLFSTYALETMVLYIFNMYVEELSSPLKVREMIALHHMLPSSCEASARLWVAKAVSGQSVVATRERIAIAGAAEVSGCVQHF